MKLSKSLSEKGARLVGDDTAALPCKYFGGLFPLSPRVTTKLEQAAPEPLVIQRLVNTKPHLTLNPS
jgi:hypothetical protein